MVDFAGKCSIEFRPQGDRFTYHTTDADEAQKLKDVLTFCEKLSLTFSTFAGTKHRANTWWTEPLKLKVQAGGHVEIATIIAAANGMLGKAAIKRSLLAKMRPDLAGGVLYYGTMREFPEAFETDPGAPADKVLNFTVESGPSVMREYYIGGDGKVHCSGLLPLSVNGQPLILSDGDFVDGAVQVLLGVDFTAFS